MSDLAFYPFNLKSLSFHCLLHYLLERTTRRNGNDPQAPPVRSLFWSAHYRFVSEGKGGQPDSPGQATAFDLVGADATLSPDSRVNGTVLFATEP